MHLPNMQAICKDIPTRSQNTHRNAISTHMMHKQVECIDSKTHTSSILSDVIHVKVSTPMYVYLRQGAQAAEDCGRQRG
jgi:hypothetical protein